MRASVRMTRYLESWGAAKPFANLHHRDSMTTDNGKINTAVSELSFWLSFSHGILSGVLSVKITVSGCSNGAVSLPETREVSQRALMDDDA